VNILMAHVHDEAPPMRSTNELISVSSAMEEVVAGCMAKDPERRFRSMDDVLTALKRVGTAEGTASTGASGSAPPNSATRLGSASRPPEPPLREGSLSGAPFEPIQAPARRGSMGVLAAAVALALVAVGAVVSVLFRPRESAGLPAPPVAVATATAAPLVSAAAATPVATAAATPVAAPVTVHVSTDPDGAIVKEDGIERCSSTPCDILYRGEDADPQREHKLSLARPGYRVETRSVKAGDSSALLVKLSPTPRPALPRAADPPAVPTGYKTDIPY